jgi:alkaline phosphatase
MHPELPSKTFQRFKRAEPSLPHLSFQPKPNEIDSQYWINEAQKTLNEHLQREKLNKNVAKNVIYFLGDGLSIATQTAARAYKGGESEKLSFEKFPYCGLAKTYCTNVQVADSACTATAYLSGVKANYGTVGLTADVLQSDCLGQSNTSYHIDSIFKWAQDAGFNTGFITTTHVTHASPAGIYANIANRYWENDARIQKDGHDPNICPDVGHQLIHNDVGKKLNIIMGGGREQLLPISQTDSQGNNGKRADGVDLIAKWKELHQDKKAAYVEQKEDLLNLNASTEYVMGIFNTKHIPFHLDADLTKIPTLLEMTQKALEILQDKKKRYFLFVEGGRIDQGHHHTLAKKALDETIEYEKAIDYARKHTDEKDTLIVTTADHSHTLTISGYAVSVQS